MSRSCKLGRCYPDGKNDHGQQITSNPEICPWKRKIIKTIKDTDQRKTA